MEYLNLNYSEKNKNKYVPILNFNYTFLNIIKENIPINFFYNFINSLDEYKLKNIWNSVIVNWNNSHKNINKSKKHKKSKYLKQIYSYNHINIKSEELNKLFNNFVDNDSFKALFIATCIVKDFHI